MVDAAGTCGFVLDQTRGLEDAEMLRDGGATDGEAAGEFTNGEWAATEAIEDDSAGLVTECVELLLVSLHLR